MNKKKILYFIKFIISCSLLYWILKDADLHRIFEIVIKSNWVILCIAISLHFIGLTLSAFRWQTLLGAQNVASNIPYLMKSYLVGIFFNNFLPSTVGGDISRAYDSYKLGNNKANAVAVIFIDRFLGLLALLIFAGIAINFTEDLAGKLAYIKDWIIVFAVFAFIFLWFLFFPQKGILLFIDKINKPPYQKIVSILKKIGDSIWYFKDKKQQLRKGMVYSILLQANVVFYYFLLSLALGLNIPLYNFFVIIPISIFVMMLPISINGIGLRENIYFLFFSAFGVIQSEAVAFAWVELGIILITGIIGGIIYAFRK